MWVRRLGWAPWNVYTHSTLGSGESRGTSLGGCAQEVPMKESQEPALRACLQRLVWRLFHCGWH